MKNKIFIVLGIIAILYAVVLTIFITGFNFGNIFTAFAGLAIAFIFFNNEYRVFNLSIRNKRIRGTLKLILLFWIISFIIVEGIIVYSIKTDAYIKADYLMILGGGLNGGELSVSLLKRMEKGVEYLEKNPDAKVIVSGGQGPGEEITEAEAMAQYLLAQGIKEDRIIKEEKSTSTMENFKYSREILKGEIKENQELVIVTNDFHMFRSKLLAKRNGFVPFALPCKTPLSVLPNFYIREYFAVIKSILFDR